MSNAAARFQRLHAELRARICLLDYPPGTRLSEETLAAEFGTSRTPLRRVLARLEDEGLLTSRHGVGTLVTDVDLAEMAQVYALRLELAQLAGQLSPAEQAQARRVVSQKSGQLREAREEAQRDKKEREAAEAERRRDADAAWGDD